MPNVLIYEHCVSEEEMDGQGHANNVAYLNWLQSAAVAHSTAQGWSTADYRRCGWSWVVRSHFIEYRRPLFAGDQVQVKTWIADMKKFSSLRKYQIVHGQTGKLVARAETNWAFVDQATGRLISIPEQVSSAFEVVDSPPA